MQQDRNNIFDRRITGQENSSAHIDNNVATILSKLDNMSHHTPSKQRKISPQPLQSDTAMAIDHDKHPSHHQGVSYHDSRI